MIRPGTVNPASSSPTCNPALNHARVLHQTPEGIMEPQHEAGFPATLRRWVREIVLSIPSRRTVAELIVGGLLSGGGHVTQAFLALTLWLGWQAYHWMLERGRFRLLNLVGALCGIVRRESGERRRFAIIDDTLAPRASAKAPGAAMRLTMPTSRTVPASCCASPLSRSAPSWPAAIGRAACRSSPACAAAVAMRARSRWPGRCCGWWAIVPGRCACCWTPGTCGPR